MVTAKFSKALTKCLKIEGGYINDPKDSGGATKYGISLKTYKEFYPKANIETIKNLTLDDASTFYHTHFWLPIYEKINDENFYLKIFDAAVNMGHHQAHICLQRALNCVGYNLKEDGILGSKTVEALNASGNKSWNLAIICSFCSELAGIYRLLVAQYPNNQKFKGGWLKRAYQW